LESFEMLYWRGTEKINWTDRVRNEEVLHVEKKEGNILHTIKRSGANWIGHILRRNCLLTTLLRKHRRKDWSGGETMKKT